MAKIRALIEGKTPPIKIMEMGWLKNTPITITAANDMYCLITMDDGRSTYLKLDSEGFGLYETRSILRRLPTTVDGCEHCPFVDQLNTCGCGYSQIIKEAKSYSELFASCPLPKVEE